MRARTRRMRRAETQTLRALRATYATLKQLARALNAQQARAPQATALKRCILRGWLCLCHPQAWMAVRANVEGRRAPAGE